MPVEIEVQTVPQFKAPVNGKAQGLWQDHAGTFTQQNGIVKLGGLVPKMGFDKTEVPMTVSVDNLQDWSRNMPIQPNVQF